MELRPRRSTGTATYDEEEFTLTIDEFQYTYKCGHCRHEWSEKRTTTKSSGGIR